MTKIAKYSIIGLIVILLIFIVYFLSRKYIGSDRQYEEKAIQEILKNKPIEKAIIDTTDDTTTYKYKHYAYTVPNNIEYSSNELTFTLSDKDKWKAVIAVMIDKKKFMTNNPDYIKKSLTDNGYVVEETYTYLVGDSQYLVIVCNKDSVKHTIAYKNLENKYGYEIDITGYDNYIVNALEQIEEIIYYAKYADEYSRFYYYIISDD